MSRTIWKYPLEVVDSQDIDMPVGAEILSAQVQHGKPCLWAKVDPDEEGQMTRIIVTHGTGHDVMNNLTFIGTYQLEGGAFIGHVFEWRD